MTCSIQVYITLRRLRINKSESRIQVHCLLPQKLLTKKISTVAHLDESHTRIANLLSKKHRYFLALVTTQDLMQLIQGIDPFLLFMFTACQEEKLGCDARRVELRGGNLEHIIKRKWVSVGFILSTPSSSKPVNLHNLYYKDND